MNDIKRIKASELTPDPHNANKGTERGRYALEASLRQYGAGRSILVDREGRIIAGNKTLETAADVGLDDVIVVQTDGTQIVAVQRMDLDLANDEQARMLAYADNRVAELDLDFDAEVLAADLAAGLPLDELWQDFELAEIMAELEPEPTPGEDTEPQIDRAAELAKEWGVETGQLWQLGDHRLICGDCTDAAVVERVMGGEKAQLTLFSDPPYGIGYAYDSHDDSDNGENLELVKMAFSLGPVSKVWSPGLMNLRRDLEWNPTAKILVWHKGFAQAGNGLGGASTWEPFLVVNVVGGNLPNDYLHFGTDREPGLRDLHSCPKPIALFEHLISHLSSGGVYEPFSGSGTTIIACENLSRQCRAVEISPGYVAVALQRWADHTGRTPELIEA